MILMIFNFNFITKIQGQGKVIGILTMHLGKLPSHRFCSVSKRFVNKKQGPINLNTINTRILDICLFIKTEWKDIKERMKTIVKRSLVWLYKILNVRMTNQQEARANLLNGGVNFAFGNKHQISFLHQIYFYSTTSSRQLFRQNINSQHLSKNLKMFASFGTKLEFIKFVFDLIQFKIQ